MRTIAKRQAALYTLLISLAIVCTGCATYPTAPQQEAVPQYRLLEVRTPPGAKSSRIVINIPQEKTSVASPNAVMRKGAIIKPDASVVISVPTVAPSPTSVSGFRTDGYFNELEQYIERGLLAVGLQVKDRAKFDAKMRDLRGSQDSKELSDIAEVIRAVQDGSVMADYVLQVNDLAVTQYLGTPLQLKTRPEVQASLSENPGLKIGGESGKTIPSTLPQTWWQARFNAKLIDAKTGSIVWIGDHTIESPSVVENGIAITIGLRRETTNGRAVVDAATNYNARVRDAYERAHAAKARLEKTYADAMQSVSYEGTPADGRRIQVKQAEQDYKQALAAYQDTVRREPSEARAEWTYDYTVDAPRVTPDLMNPKTEDDQRIVLEHIRAFGLTVTHDLLGTMTVAP